MRRTAFARLALLLLVVRASTARGGGITVFDNQSDFFRAAQIVSTETFDEFPHYTILGHHSVTVDKIVYNSRSLWIAGIGLMPTVSPPNDFGTTKIDDNTLSFGGGSTDAIGFFMGTGGIFPVPHFQIIVTTTRGEVLLEPLSFTDGVRYRGFLSPDGIISVTVRDDPSYGGAFNWSFDNVSRGVLTIPEPSSLVLLGTGAVGLLGYGAWRRSRTRA